MTSGVPLIKQDWVPLFREFIKYIRINSKEVPAIDSLGAPVDLWPGQETALKTVVEGMERGIHTFMFGKSRQVGISTLFEMLDIFWLATHPGMMGAYVIDKEKNLPAIRDKIKRYFNSFPKGFFGRAFAIENDNKDFMLFSNGSRLDFLTAGVGKKETHWGEGKGYSFAHLCMAKGTPVIVRNGKIKNVEDVKIGDEILTHTGKVSKVIDVFGQSGKGMEIVEVSPWLGRPIRYTRWHKIPTQRGLIQAGDLREDDFLIMPIRKITSDIKTFALPDLKKIGGAYAVDERNRFVSKGTEGARIVKREAWSNVKTKAKNRTIEVNEELGFAVGYYLAEGHLVLNAHDKTPCGIIFARHRNESAYSDRAIEAIKNYTTGSKKTVDRKNSLTSHVNVYGTEFCKWLNDHFGRTDDKIIPDEVFNWGEDFCRGLLCGILCGDGSKAPPFPAKSRLRAYKDTYSKNGKKIGTKRGLSDPDKNYDLNSVILPSTRSSLVMQIRDIAASLGYGWPSLYYREEGRWYGRNCKPVWRLQWNGEAAYKLRILMGLSPYPKKGYNFIQKYKIEGDRVLIRIKNIIMCQEEKEVWDISVDHSDHTFRTPYMSTSNTEVSKYGNAEGLASFRATLAESNPDRLYIYESQSNGMNHWRMMWDEFGQDIFRKRRNFIGFWGNPFNVLKKGTEAYKVFAAAPPDPAEQELIDKVKNDYGFTITQAQLAWYRQEHNSSTSLPSLYQTFPWTIEQSFVATGYSFFNMGVLGVELLRCQDIQFKGYKYIMGNDFWSVQCEQICDEKRVGEVVLRVWEEPVEEATYVIGLDPAHGRDEENDRHAICVCRVFGDKMVQVAEYADNETGTRQAAWVLAHLAGAYKNCIINVEAAPGPGGVIMNELENLRERMRIDERFDKAEKKIESWQDFLSNARWYLYKKPDHFAPGYVKGWESTWRTKVQIMEQLRDKFATECILIRSIRLIEEMIDVVRDGDSIGAPESAKDDRVIALALCNRTWIDSLMLPLLAQGDTYANYLREQNGEPLDKSVKFMNNLVQTFFMDAEQRAEIPRIDPHQQWLYDRGFI